MSEITPSILHKKLIFKRFKLVKLLYLTDFSWVYEGKNTVKNVPVAMKIEYKTKCDFLESEAYFLTSVKGFGIPKVISFGKYGPFKILIEELLGKNLSTLWKSGPFKNDRLGQKNKYIKDICLFAMQGLERLKYIHAKNIIHRDIKTNNFIIGRKDPDIIYLIDFGFAKKYRSSRTGKHIRFSNNGKLIGSMAYSSCNSMKGYESSRRDDLESFGYILIFLAKGGSMPWMKYIGMKNLNAGDKELIILKMKMEITEENLCKGLPDEFIDYMKYVKKLQFEQEPDYKYLINLFISILSKNEIIKNINFFWITQKSENEKKICESKDSNISNKIPKYNWNNNSRDFSLKRLYNKIKESLVNRNIVNNNYNININTFGKNEKKFPISLWGYNTNKNKNNINTNYVLNNTYSNKEIELSKKSIEEAINKQLTITNTDRNENSKLYTININNKNNITLTQKININNKNSNYLKYDSSNEKYKKNIKLYNNIYFISKIPSKKINLSNYSRLNESNHVNKYKSLENSVSSLNLKKNILYKPIFKTNLISQLNKKANSFYKNLFSRVNINTNEF